MESLSTTQRRPVIPHLVADRLTSEIRSGAYAPGSLLPSDGLLASKYCCGRSSMIGALQLLEQQGLVAREQGKGTFVVPDVQQRLQSKRIAICRALPPVPNMDSVGTTMELYAGAIEGGNQCGATVSIEHLAPTTEEFEIQRQWELLAEFDGIIFLGEDSDYLLRVAQQNKKSVLRVPSSASFFPQSDVGMVSLDVDHMLECIADYLLRNSYGSAAIFIQQRREALPSMASRFAQYKSNLLRLKLGDRGIRAEEFSVSDEEGELHLRKKIGEIISPDFCNRFDVVVPIMTTLLPFLYHRFYEQGKIPGRDIGILALCSRIALLNLLPKPILYHINYEEIGFEAVKLLCRMLREPNIGIQNQFLKWQVSNPA